MAKDLEYFQNVNSRLSSAEQSGNDGAMLEVLKALEDNLHFTTPDLLQKSGLGKMVNRLTRAIGSPRACAKSRDLKERMMSTLNIKACPRDEAPYPAKLKRPWEVSTDGQGVHIQVKRARQAPAAEQASEISEDSSTRASDSEYFDEPFHDVLEESNTISVDIAARSTVDKDGDVPLNEVGWRLNNGDDQIWQLVRTYSKDRIKVPEKMLPNSEQDFVDTGVRVHDARGHTYDLSNTLLTAYKGCGACGESIGGVCFIQDGSTCHSASGCTDFSRQYIDTRLGIQLYIEWPARALPKGWGKPRPVQKSAPFCATCGEKKAVYTRKSADNDIKWCAFCPGCR